MACGHANCAYWILDADTGKTLRVMMGGFDFTWSHDGHWLLDEPSLISVVQVHRTLASLILCC